MSTLHLYIMMGQCHVYFASINNFASVSFQEEQDRELGYPLQAFDVQKGYFTCPLCRQLSNGVLPILPQSIRRRNDQVNIIQLIGRLSLAK